VQTWLVCAEVCIYTHYRDGKIPGNGLSGFVSPSDRIQQNPIRGATRVKINILLCVVPKIDAVSPAGEQASTAADV
jgi:hypothetical protein